MFPQLPVRLAAVFPVRIILHANNAAELRVDAHAPYSMLHWPLVTTVLNRIPASNVSVGFVMEGKQPTELPETIFAAVRLQQFAFE